MARIQISEYTAKRLLLGDTYAGNALTRDTLQSELSTLDANGRYVCKVDQGIKKRHKQGLVAIDIALSDVAEHIKKFATKGFQQFVLEPLVPHQTSDERYISIERVREGLQILYSTEGGVEIEQAGDSVGRMLYKEETQQLHEVADKLGVPFDWLTHLIARFNELHVSFVEINPLVVLDGQPLMLDCAAELDSAAAYFMNEWSLDDDVSVLSRSPAEQAVGELAANSASSFSLKVVQTDGGLGMLLSGGGASVAIADEVCNLGQAHNLLNYGEYSGNPTREETYLYTTQVLNLLLGSKATKKALVIAGGVANFTDIKQTFLGVIEALEGQIDQLKQQHIKVFVRRGGPNEAEGLTMMRTFLHKHDIYGEVVGSESLLTQAAASAVEYIR